MIDIHLMVRARGRCGKRLGQALSYGTAQPSDDALADGFAPFFRKPMSS